MKKILLLLANGYETFEAAVFIDVIGWNLIDGDKSTKLFSCGLTKEVNSSFDQKCIVDYLIDDININDYDALAIPGGFEAFEFYKDAYDKKFLNLIEQITSKINSGLQTGGLVKLASDYKSKEGYKNQNKVLISWMI